MLLATGSIDADGTPRIHFELSGRPFRRGKAGPTLEGVIDTGFVGFVSIPIEQAFLRELPVAGFTYAKVADGRTTKRLTAKGYARIGNRSEQVAIILEPSSDEILIGVALLRALDLALLLSRDQVLLLDERSASMFVDLGSDGDCVRDSSGLPDWGTSITHENLHDLSQSEVHEESGNVGVASGARG